ncbi:MAG: aspartate--tRNA ligase, partial [Candidatus Methylomirabilales bacterium]
MKRSCYCGEVSVDRVDRTVTLCGWVHRRRDHGGLVFVDLRDRAGIVQVVFGPGDSPEAFETAKRLRAEFVVAVEGLVLRRPAGTENPDLRTGTVEVRARRLEILSEARTPVFPIDEETPASEETRLTYRYLDLRRPALQEKLLMRHRITQAVRRFFDRHGFVEIETPVLTRSTPEGARDYLVPSRLYPGHFFALPQSPQLFKQLLMVAGFDRYVQIVRCFRDEDLRADRQPEFTQIDLEMSFADRDDVLAITEEMVQVLFREIRGVELEKPFPRLSYAEAIARYGTDRPDLRFDMPLVDVSDLVQGVAFRPFGEALAQGGQVKGLCLQGRASEVSRKTLEAWTEFAKGFGATGLTPLRMVGDRVESPVAKFIGTDALQAIANRVGLREGDLFLLVADQPPIVAEALGRLRGHLGQLFGLVASDQFRPLWVIDFPLLEFNSEEGRYQAVHHPFTAPVDEDLPLFDTAP